ncbi:hypothetical protein [Coleofasciculus sp. E1-EBD-02]|uniref:hypothetical protein n=1 Tax=Coleofasciculus sp. E1-EBD-02 TaxID=3068481 RepID=UPI003303BDC2
MHDSCSCYESAGIIVLIAPRFQIYAKSRWGDRIPLLVKMIYPTLAQWRRDRFVTLIQDF